MRNLIPHFRLKIFFPLQRRVDIKSGLKTLHFCTDSRKFKTFHKSLELLSYCLMPNHFHLLVKQVAKTSMESFIHSLLLRYSMYFNKKYDRVGPLFQGRFKGVLIDNDSYLLHLTRYIHLNPSEYVKDLSAAYSSYAEYLGLRNTLWVKTDFLFNFFNKNNL